jgi:hypothetical protein
MRNMLKFLKWLFAAPGQQCADSDWQYDQPRERRHCTVCGRREKLDPPDGATGGAWLPEWRGYPKAHAAQRS